MKDVSKDKFAIRGTLNRAHRLLCPLSVRFVPVLGFGAAEMRGPVGATTEVWVPEGPAKQNPCFPFIRVLLGSLLARTRIIGKYGLV
ncbi:MAG: hypothetical protein ACE5IR_18640 [bacterium]